MRSARTSPIGRRASAWGAGWYGGIADETLTDYDRSCATRTFLMVSGQAVGINIGIFNPRLDRDGSIARQLTAFLIAGLAMR